MTTPLPEYWMRGPIDGIPSLLQPVAHALLQAEDEITRLMVDFPSSLLWQQPAGSASPAFHLQHICGVIDRMFTYAKPAALSPLQHEQLVAEGAYKEDITLAQLLEQLHLQIEDALAQLKLIEENTLTQFRGVGRKQLPSTLQGLLFHAAEHTMRHVGQLIVTVKVLKHAAM